MYRARSVFGKRSSEAVGGRALLACQILAISFVISTQSEFSFSYEESGIAKATEVVSYFESHPEYADRYWYNYWPVFNVYAMRKNLTDEEQYRMIYSFLEDNAALIKPHMNESCNHYFFIGTEENRDSKRSRIFSMYSGVFSLDPELGHAWMMYLLERSFWERLWGGNRLWKAFRKSCRNEGVSVENALASIAAGRKHAYEAGK